MNLSKFQNKPVGYTFVNDKLDFGIMDSENYFIGERTRIGHLALEIIQGYPNMLVLFDTLQNEYQNNPEIYKKRIEERKREVASKLETTAQQQAL
ncbi:MAG: hypothetical protein U9R08_01955 [Nanoarchaeota archaeon]|nr:hypothetical protein [Nanoarchaeota archaeon]